MQVHQENTSVVVESNVNQHLVAMLLMFQITMQEPKNTNVGYMETKIQSLLLAWMEHATNWAMDLMRALEDQDS